MAGSFFWTRYPTIAGISFDAVMPGLGHGCKQSLEAFSHSTRLEKIFSASWNETCYLQVSETPLPNANFSARA